MSDPTKPVINHLPAPVIVLVLILTLGEFYITGAEARFWGSSESRIALIRQVAFLPEIFQRSLLAGIWVPELFLRLITYPFVHGSLLQAVFAGVLTLALGKFLAEVLGSFAVILIFFGSSMFAALGYSFFTNDSFPLFGSFPAAYGLIGAFTFVLFG
ncbi:MAG: rhomboid family intramembrane serine protease, partial [Planktomarina sp.]|nr:rhomboid family intramembrane serine protease [Planktomarina sp.]